MANKVTTPGGKKVSPRVWVEPAESSDGCRWLWIEVAENDWTPIFLATEDIDKMKELLG